MNFENSRKAFKAYDLRGKVPDELNEELAYRIGRVFADLLGARQVVVGRDARLSGEMVAGLVEGALLGCGVDVIDVALLPDFKAADNTPTRRTVPVSRRRLWGMRNWAPLASLKRQWESIQQRWAEYNWSGQCDKAIAEIRGLLQSTAETLKNRANTLSRRLDRKERREARQLDAVATEIETYLETLKNEPADPTLLYRSQVFIRERLIERYEALSCKYVTMRRRVNDWRFEAFQRLNRGRLVAGAFAVSRRFWLAFVDVYLSLRFTIAAMRKEL